MRRRSPFEASTQEHFDSARSDYAAAKASRYRRKRTGVAASGSGADYHYRNEGDYLRLLELARDMDRNDVIVGQTVDRAVNNCLQDGMVLDVKTGDTGLDKELWYRWEDFSEDPDKCDLQGEMSFADIETLSMRSQMVDGDIFALPNEDGPLEMIEGHRCRKPSSTTRNVVHGILLDANRRRQEYWFTREDLEPTRSVTKVSQIERYPARDEDGHRQVFHIYNPKRVSQTRGVTAFAPIFDPLGMFEDINFANLVRSQITSCFAIFRETSDQGSINLPAPTGPQTTETQSDGTTRVIQGVAPGMEVIGKPGEKLTGFSPNVPGDSFFPHMRLILQLVGINLGLPLVLVLLDASETNFSGFRGAVDQARLGFRRNQRSLIRRLHKPCYAWKVRQWAAEDPAIAAAAKKSGVKLNGHRWEPPAWPYIEPMKDASTDLLRLRNMLSSPRRIHAERNRDVEEIVDETLADNVSAIRKAKRAANELNKEFPGEQPVHWRECLSLPTPDGVTVQLANNDAGETNKPKGDRDA